MRKVHVSRLLAEKAIAYTKAGTDDRALLVLGDSTAVGVGASRSEDSLAARMADEIRASRVENYAVSGARVRDLTEQLSAAQLEEYALILIGIGANDVVRFADAQTSAATLSEAMKGLPLHHKLVVYMAGNLGGTNLFPSFMNEQYRQRTLAYHAAFARVVSEQGGTYVNLYADPEDDPFAKDPERYLAQDGFHPSSDGYALWFEKIRNVLQ